MPRLIRLVIWLLIAAAFFLGGVFGGVYYHNEIIVVYRALFGREISATPAVLSNQDQLDIEQQIILPNLETGLPLVYSDTLDETQVQELLKGGAVVLPLGTSFGHPGNVVITAHSSGTEAFGPYRFAFAKLSELEIGDEYFIETPQAKYTYRVYAKEIVWPHEVDKLPQDDRSTVTLVTCWPLWTNFQRLLVHTELVSTDYQI